MGVDLSNAYQIHIYVDGGFAPAGDLDAAIESCNATWAFAVVAVNEHMQGKLMCSSGGHVTFNNESNVFLGENNFSSFDPELYAQIMARLYILQQSEPFQAPVFIGYDNISAADCSFMKSVKTDESLLAGLAAAVHIESTKNHSVEGFHTHPPASGPPME